MKQNLKSKFEKAKKKITDHAPEIIFTISVGALAYLAYVMNKDLNNPIGVAFLDAESESEGEVKHVSISSDEMKKRLDSGDDIIAYSVNNNDLNFYKIED